MHTINALKHVVAQVTGNDGDGPAVLILETAVL